MAVTALFSWFLNITLGDEFVLMLGMFVIVGLIEYFFPALPAPRRHYWLNVSYGFVNIFLVSTLLLPVSAVVAYAIQGIGFGLIDIRAFGFEGLKGSLVAVLIGTVIWDFLQYWEHRLYHGSQFFWQMHLLHHSDEHMDVTTATRHHVFENLLAPFFVTIPTAILFQVPPVDIAILSLLPYMWVYLTHANINFGLGPLWWLLTSPNYHRIHHSLTAEHIDRNFVNWFPIWDIIFRTAVIPRSSECPPTGVAGVTVRSIGQAYLLPFKGWRRMVLRRLDDRVAAHAANQRLPHR
jgi:sterol desaturase/sphingolipid hydroxylase (fatty acid hydroxylase superfamily)